MGTSSKTGSGLRVAAAIVTIVVAAVVGLVSWTDSGAFAFVLAGVPLVAAATVLVFASHRRSGMVTTWAATVIVMAWALLTGLGTGLYLLVPGVVLLVAAVATSSREGVSRRSTSVASSAR